VARATPEVLGTLESGDEAERVAGGIQEYAEPTVAGRLVLVPAGTEREHVGLGGVDVTDAEVEVELLGMSAARQVGAVQSSIRWNASAGRPSRLSGVTPPPGGVRVAQSRLEPRSSSQRSSAE
jgi:hypothetical protein